MSSTKYTRGSSLAEFFLEWQQAGYSVSEMKAILDQRIRHGVITVVPSLPASWRLRLTGSDGFMIETADDYLDAGKFHYYYWAPLPDWLRLPLPVQAAQALDAGDGEKGPPEAAPTEVQHSGLRRLEAPAAKAPKAAPSIPSVRERRKIEAAERRAKKAERETQLVEWLMPKPDLRKKRARYWAEARQVFPGITMRGLFRAVGKAREKLGRPGRRKRGQSGQSKKS